MDERLQEALRRYFEQRSEIAMAFAFGSHARDRATRESDLDIAVYFTPAGRRLEWEEEGADFPGEETVWRDVEEITGLETDLLVLNRAPSTIAFAALHDGIPLVIKDRSLYWRYYLTISSAAEDFRSFVRDFWAIKQRSMSLNAIDRDRLIRILDFIDSELMDLPEFTKINRQLYFMNSAFRRNVERWAENLINASIDVAKILLASTQMRIPQTYRKILENLSLLEGFDDEVSRSLGRFARLRNLLAHEYLDQRYTQIAALVQEVEPRLRYLMAFTRATIERQPDSASDEPEGGRRSRPE